MGSDEGRSVVKPVAAAIGVLGTMASIWWFALKPRWAAKREQRRQAGSSGSE